MFVTSEDIKKLMQEKLNMMKLDHEVWSGKSDTCVKSSQLEEPTMECQEEESLLGWGVEKQRSCRDTANEEAAEHDDRSSESEEVTMIEISEEPMKAGWEDARNLVEAKKRYVEDPIQRRESCADDANEAILVRAADVENDNGTVESCGDDAEEPMMVDTEDAEKPREAAQAADEDIHAVDYKSTEGKVEYAEKPTE